MKYLKTFLLIIIFLHNTALTIACTGFCVYSKKPIYGMNFDYPEVEIKFLLQTSGDMKIFHMQFETEQGFVSTVGMNNKGLFCSEQEQYPLKNNLTPKKKNELHFWDLYHYALINFNNSNHLLEYISDKKLIHSQYPSLHLLAGDVESNSVIVEVGYNNAITLIKNRFLIMTNFRNADFLARPYGNGADRYNTAYNYISKNINNYDFSHGIETLKQTVQSDGVYKTLCSMLFLPGENAVYIIMQRNFKKSWKLSLKQNTIETFTGFEQDIKIDLKPSGILASKLVTISNKKNHR